MAVLSFSALRSDFLLTTNLADVSESLTFKAMCDKWVVEDSTRLSLQVKVPFSNENVGDIWGNFEYPITVCFGTRFEFGNAVFIKLGPFHVNFILPKDQLRYMPFRKCV